MHAYEQDDEVSWNVVQRHVPSRSDMQVMHSHLAYLLIDCAQCRERWRNVNEKHNKAFSEEDDKRLLQVCRVGASQCMQRQMLSVTSGDML